MCDYLKQARKIYEPGDFRRINKNALEKAKKLKTAEAELIRAIQDVDKSKTYRYLGFNSLRQYCLQALDLTEWQTGAFIAVARKSYEVPALQKAIENNEITVSKANRVTSVLDNKNQMQWLTMARVYSKRRIEKEVAKVSPRSVKRESEKYISDTELQLSVVVSEDIFKKLERVKDLLFQKEKEPVKLDECIEALCDLYIEKNDPVEKAKRALKRESKREGFETLERCNIDKAIPNKPDSHKRGEASSLAADYASASKSSARAELQTTDNRLRNGHLNTRSKMLPSYRVAHRNPEERRQKIPAHVIHRIQLRDKGKCQWKNPDKSKCLEAKWTEVHHITPVSKGGKNNLNNLITLCSGHHKSMHMQEEYM